MGGFKAVRLNADSFPVDDNERNMLRDAGISELVEIEGSTPEEIMEAGRDADVVLIISAKVRRPVIERLERCKLLCRYGTGTDNIDIDAATERGIVVTNVPDFCLGEMADHTMALLLGVTRKLLVMHRRMLAGDWIAARKEEQLHRMQGKTLGLLGFGNIAREVAKRAQAFGLRVIDYHRHVNPEVEKQYGVEPVSFERLIRESDFLVLMCALTPETEGIIGEREIAMMKRDAVLINTSRGALVDETALALALKNGRIAGAGLDCFFHINVHKEAQDEVRSPFFELDNVILTPHIGGTSVEASEENHSKAIQEVKKVLRGEWPQNIVNPGVKPWFELKQVNA